MRIQAGSSATPIATPNTATLSFVPDVAGMYVASVTVSDGKSASLAYVTIRALNSTPSQVTLPFVRATHATARASTVSWPSPPARTRWHSFDPYTGRSVLCRCRCRSRRST